MDYEELAETMSEAFSTFKGHDLRIDAGEEGKIYVALRGARRNEELARPLAQVLGTWIEDALKGTGYEFALSFGRGDRDLLLLVEIRKT